MRRYLRFRLIGNICARAGACLAIAVFLAAEPAFSDPLEDGFNNPPQSARPRVWWHWLNGNVSIDGIDKDLAWMARVGIGGVQNFDASLQTPQIVPKRLVYMQPDWKFAFRHAVETADAKGLEFAIAASPGWSETGGPWVPAKDGMKKLVWSETFVQGGKRARGALARAPTITGPYQRVRFFDPLGAQTGAGAAPVPPEASEDIAIFAVPVLPRLPRASVTTGTGTPLDDRALTDGDLETTVTLPASSTAEPTSLLLAYASPVTVRSARLFVPHARPPFGDSLFSPQLEAQVSGVWQRVAVFPLGEAATTVSFPAVTARRFRLVMAANTAPKAANLGAGAPGAIAFDIFSGSTPKAVSIGEFSLSPDPAVDRAEAKAGFVVATDYAAMAPPPATAAIPAAKVRDLTGRLRADGTLDWIAPPGTMWRVLRFGWSLTGKTNHPAVPEATGLEVDKYDAAAVRQYLETYLGMYRDAVGPNLIGSRGIRALLTDSIEVGASNWTPRMLQEFRARRGYDARPWLPALAGAVIRSAAATDSFLADYRRTLADLLADAHYATVATVAHEHGLAVYGEALENGRPVLGDDMAMRRHTDIPMAAMWTFDSNSGPRPTLLGDMKGAASVAHLYGQNIVAAESLTSAFSPWAFAPADLKPVIDLEFAYGINRPVIHTSVHQPVDDKQPGLSLAIFGQYFNRHESWAEMAKPWIDYIARTSFLLQQGHDHADIAYFYGEDTPLTAQFDRDAPDDLPRRYAYDFVNADCLLTQLSVSGNKLQTTSGARYDTLFLGAGAQQMSLPILRRIAELAESGATVVGTRPNASPTLARDSAAFGALADRLWAGGIETRVGKGRIITSRSAEAWLAAANVPPGFAFDSTDADIRFVQRSTSDAEVFFINNRANGARSGNGRFRVTGKLPELWDAITGQRRLMSYRQEGNVTVVPLDLPAQAAVFVIFRAPSAQTSAVVRQPSWHPIALIDGPWTVAFQPGRGAPAGLRMKSLSPLNASADLGVRYFSGTANYTTSIRLPQSAVSGSPLALDLGKVGDVAEVRVNGTLAGTVWTAPYRVDVGNLLHAGTNSLEIRVANLWVNRLVGDQQPGAAKIAFTAAPTYRPDAPLRPSGLLGPVSLIVADRP